MLRAGVLWAARAGKSFEPRRATGAGAVALGQGDGRLYSQQAVKMVVNETETQSKLGQSILKTLKSIFSPARHEEAKILPKSNKFELRSHHNDKIKALFHQNNNVASAARDAFFQGERAGNHTDWTIDEYTYLARRFDQIRAHVFHGTGVFLAIWQAVISRDLGKNKKLLEVVVNAHVVRERKQRTYYFRLKRRVDEERARIAGQKADKRHLKGLESVIADATKKNWKLTPPVLRMVLQTYIGIRVPQKVEEWVTLMAQQSVRPSLGEYCAIIRMYGRTGDVGNAQRYLETYLQSLERELHLFGATESMVRDQDSVFAAFISALGDSKKAGIWSAVFERLMPQHNVVPGIRSYHALMQTYFDKGDVEAAKALFQRMTDEKALPTPIGPTYNFAFAGAIQAKDLEFAAQMLTRLQNETFARLNFLNVSSYGRICLEAGKLEEALAAYKILIANDAVPDTLFTILLLKALFKTQPDHAFHILKQRIANPADRTVDSLINALTEVAIGNVPALLRLQKLAMSSSQDGRWWTRPKLLQSYEQQHQNLKLTIEDFTLLYQTLFQISPLSRASILKDIPKYHACLLAGMAASDLQPTQELHSVVTGGLEKFNLDELKRQWEKILESEFHRLWNVNFPIVSQGSPHIVLFFFARRVHRHGQGRRGGFVASALVHHFKLDLQKWMLLIKDFDFLPQILDTVVSDVVFNALEEPSPSSPNPTIIPLHPSSAEGVSPRWMSRVDEVEDISKDGLL
ncbi:hypothetical protein DFS34DRAFT_665431 [Phlyctochytrium arcticum]|nr:hypothetical protein DFS34DRAFT_665431 [Phlyctochytrium arcticum]